MTLPDYVSANDEIKGLFLADWRALAPALNGGVVPPIEWKGVDSGTPPPADAPWARVTVRHTSSPRQTLAKRGEGRVTRLGLVFIQIFAPIANGQGLLLAQQLAIIARNAYERKGTASGIWFRRARVQEVGADGTWEQINVSLDFQYDEQQ
jgi:hypothetical protein